MGIYEDEFMPADAGKAHLEPTPCPRCAEQARRLEAVERILALSNCTDIERVSRIEDILSTPTDREVLAVVDAEVCKHHDLTSGETVTSYGVSAPVEGCRVGDILRVTVHRRKESE